jgi:hypothetical protein
MISTKANLETMCRKQKNTLNIFLAELDRMVKQSDRVDPIELIVLRDSLNEAVNKITNPQSGAG